MATRKKAVKAVRKRKQPIYMAVVMTKGQIESKRSHGDYSCFLGYDKKELVGLALEKAEKWTETGYGPYVIGIGQLTEYAQPIRYRPFRIEKA